MKSGNSQAARIFENSGPLPPLTSVACTVTALYRTHAGFVERVLRRSGVAERDLADACQEVFVVVHRRLAEFEGRSSTQTWLYRIAWNVASEYRRRAYRRRELLNVPDATDAVSDVQVPDEQLETQHSIAALLDAIDHLDPDKRDALICHELEEQPMIIVAKRLHIPLKTAFSRLYAARRAVKLELHKRGWACVPWWSFTFERMLPHVAPASRIDAWWLAAPARSVLTVVLLGLVPTAAIPNAKPQPMRLLPPLAATTAPVIEVPRAPNEAAVPPARENTRRTRPRAQVETTALATAREPATLVLGDLTVTRTGRVDLGRGPFGESPLAAPPLVEPQRHPRAKLPPSSAR